MAKKLVKRQIGGPGGIMSYTGAQTAKKNILGRTVVNTNLKGKSLTNDSVTSDASIREVYGRKGNYIKTKSKEVFTDSHSPKQKITEVKTIKGSSISKSGNITPQKEKTTIRKYKTGGSIKKKK